MTSKLRNNAIQREEYVTSRWVIKVESTTTLKDLVTPAFYSDVANKLRENDYIRAVFADKSQVVDLLVLEVDSKNSTPVWAKVAITHVINITEALKKTEELTKEEKAKEAAPKIEKVSHPDYEIKFRGIKKHSIIQKSDGTVLQEGLSTFEAANEALKELISKLS